MYHGISQWLSGEESACNAGATAGASSTPGFGRSSGGGHGNLALPWQGQYSCLENPMDREDLVSYSPEGCKELDITEVTEHTHAYMYNIFIHSSVDRHLDCCHVFAIGNCCNEHWGAHILSDHVVLQIYAQEWDCRVIQ